MAKYIFGYGSLLEKESRLRTNPKANKVYPVTISGLFRGWFARTGVEGLTTTFLGCIESHLESKVNGIIYQVSEKELAALDERELGYKRKVISLDQTQDYAGILRNDDQIFTFLNEFPNGEVPRSQLPCAEFPIVQSYVDMCIAGCFELEQEFDALQEEEFAIEFIKTTAFWSSFWVNDRIYPRRPFIYRPDAYKIDRVLKENLENKEIFNSIYFE